MVPARAYAKANHETASKERLMVLLFEAALRHMRHAATLFEQQKPGEALPLLTKASDIVAELAGTLDLEKAGALGPMLSDVYVFVAERLAVAAWSRDPKIVNEAARAFAPIVEAFQQAVAAMSQAEATSAP